MRRVLCFVTGSPPAHTRSGGAPHRGQLSTPLLPGPLPLQSSPCNSTGTCKRLVAAVSGHGGSAGRAHGPGHRRRPHNRRRRPAAPVEPTAPGNRSATAAGGGQQRRWSPRPPATAAPQPQTAGGPPRQRQQRSFARQQHRQPQRRPAPQQFSRHRRPAWQRWQRLSAEGPGRFFFWEGLRGGVAFVATGGLLPSTCVLANSSEACHNLFVDACPPQGIPGLPRFSRFNGEPRTASPLYPAVRRSSPPS
jgi:hypothetical protein